MLLYVAIAMTAAALGVWIRQDWFFLRNGRRRGSGHVIGHERVTHEGEECFRAIVAWRDEAGAERQFTDAALAYTPEPPIGSATDIEFPSGRPDLARKPRAQLRIVVYLLLVGLLALLVASALGHVSPGARGPAGL